MPIISIITINYNNIEGLKRTVESIVNQTWREFEFIVIDGGSIDGSAAYIESQSGNFDYWVSEPDGGIYNAMNKGVKLASGEYLLFINSGDYFYNREVIRDIKDCLTGEDIICFDIHLLGKGHDYIHSHPDHLTFYYLFENSFAHQSVCIKKSLFDKVGYYDESLKVVADWKFFIHAIAFYKSSYKCVKKTLSVFHFDGISATAMGTSIRKREREKILLEDFGVFYSDYLEMRKLRTNRFKLLSEIERSKFGKKCFSLILRIGAGLFSDKKMKDIIS